MDQSPSKCDKKLLNFKNTFATMLHFYQNLLISLRDQEQLLHLVHRDGSKLVPAHVR